jgi:hypothetical protein
LLLWAKLPPPLFPRKFGKDCNRSYLVLTTCTDPVEYVYRCVVKYPFLMATLRDQCLIWHLITHQSQTRGNAYASDRTGCRFGLNSHRKCEDMWQDAKARWKSWSDIIYLPTYLSTFSFSQNRIHLISSRFEDELSYHWPCHACSRVWATSDMAPATKHNGCLVFLVPEESHWRNLDWIFLYQQLCPDLDVLFCIAASGYYAIDARFCKKINYLLFLQTSCRCQSSYICTCRSRY